MAAFERFAPIAPELVAKNPLSGEFIGGEAITIRNSGWFMMYLFLLSLIYLAFISLGLPLDSLKAGWPVMQQSFQVPSVLMGIVSMTISGGTICSSLLSERLTRKFGTGLVTAASVFLTAGAPLLFSISSSF